MSSQQNRSHVVIAALGVVPSATSPRVAGLWAAHRSRPQPEHVVDVRTEQRGSESPGAVTRVPVLDLRWPVPAGQRPEKVAQVVRAVIERNSQPPAAVYAA